MNQKRTTNQTDKSICIKIYLKPEAFAEIAQDAEKAGIRRKGLLLYTAKRNGFAGEQLANTDAIGKYLKFTAKYYQEHEADRMAEAAKAAQELKAAQDKARKLGVAIE